MTVSFFLSFVLSCSFIIEKALVGNNVFLSNEKRNENQPTNFRLKKRSDRREQHRGRKREREKDEAQMPMANNKETIVTI